MSITVIMPQFLKKHSNVKCRLWPKEGKKKKLYISSILADKVVFRLRLTILNNFTCILELNNEVNGWWMVGTGFSFFEWKITEKQGDKTEWSYGNGLE